MPNVYPEIFKANSAEDYLDAAIEAANWIDSLAIKTEYGRIWKALPDGQDGYGANVAFFTPKALFDGSSGIGIFFVRLYEATGDARWLLEAEEAAAHILATEVGSDWYYETLHPSVPRVRKGEGFCPLLGWSAGAFNGPVGEALFLENLCQVTGKQLYRDFVLRTADALLEAAIRDEKGIHWSEDAHDVMGDGGFIAFLLVLYRKTREAKYLEAAKEAANSIAAEALDAPTGGKVWKPLDLSLIGHEKGMNFPNWQHGTTGIAWLFAALYEDSKDEKFLELARQGLDYVIGISVGDETARLIPFTDHPERGPSYDKFYLGTCQGAVGSSLGFRAFYEASGEDFYKDWTLKLSRGIIRAGAPERRSWGFWYTQCICCGTAGMLEHFVRTYEFTRKEEFLDYAKRAADVLVSTADFQIPGQKAWYDSWWRTIPTRIVSYPGLYVGAAGCGSSLLSVYAALSGKKLSTNILEYQLFGK